MRSLATKTSQWIFFVILYLFSSSLLILAFASEVSLTEIKNIVQKREFNEPSRLHNLSGGIKRSLSSKHRKRDGTEKSSKSDDTKNNKTSTSTTTSDSASTTDDYDLMQAYFTPNVSEAHALLSKKLSVNKFMATHRSEWIGCCSESLTSGSESFQKNETFVDVGCYEVSHYDPTGENPGDPVNDFTQEVIDKLRWSKEDAKKKAKALREEFANQSSSNSTSTAKKNDDSTGTGVQKSKDDTSKTEDDTSTEKKKQVETTTPQTGDDGSEKKEKTTSTTPDDTTSSDKTSTNSTSTTNTNSKSKRDSQKRVEITNKRR